MASAVALEKTTPAGVDTFQAGRVTVLAAAHGLHDTYQAFLAPLLPEFIEKFALSNANAGLLAVFLRAPSLLQPVIGYLADRVRLRYFVILAPAVATVTMSLLGVAPSYALLALLLLVAGVNSACIHATGPVLVGRLSGARLGQGMGFWMVGGESGRVLGPLVISAALGVLGMAGLPWLMVAGLAVSLLLYFLLRDLPETHAETAQTPPWRDALREMAPFLVLILGLVLTIGVMMEALSTYLPILLRGEGVEPWLANLALSVFQAAGVLGAFLSGAVSDRWGRKRVISVCLLSAPVLMLAFLQSPLWLRMILLLGLGATTISLTPVLMALVQENYPQSRALANGLYMALSFVLRSVLTWGVGALGDWIGLPAAFAVSAGVMLPGLLVAARLPGVQKV